MKIKTFEVEDFSSFSDEVNNFTEGKDITKMKFIEKDGKHNLVIAYDEQEAIKDVHIATFHGDRRRYDFDVLSRVREFIQEHNVIDVQFASGDGDDHFMVMYKDNDNEKD